MCKDKICNLLCSGPKVLYLIDPFDEKVTTAVTLLVMAGGPATIETVVRLDAEDTAQTRTMVIPAPTSGWTMIPHCPLAASEFSAVRSS